MHEVKKSKTDALLGPTYFDARSRLEPVEPIPSPIWVGSKECEVQNAEFIAAASPETILSLCSELTAARERIEKLDGCVRQYRGNPDRRHDFCKTNVLYPGMAPQDDRCSACELADELLEAGKVGK
jgi:hypothetical protein